MRNTLEPTDDCIWAPVPDVIANRIQQWRTMLVAAVPVLKPTDHIDIDMIEGLFDLPSDLRDIINAASRMTPVQAMLKNGLQIKRINEIESAIVLMVDCPELQDFRERLSDQVGYPLDTTTAKWEPCIEVARFENAIADVFAVQQLEAYGIAGEKFIIDHVHVGTKQSNVECSFLGHSPLMFSDGEPIDKTTIKAAGMSTLDGESGGFLMGQIVVQEDEDDDDEDDDIWMNRALSMSDMLDGEY